MDNDILSITHPTEVTAEMLKKEFEKRKIKGIDFANQTGVNKTNVSAWINGKRPMGNTVKALFYYYFLSKSTKQ